MHRINQQRQRASRPSPNRYNTDTYIIQYKQSKEKINNPKEVLTVPVSTFELLKDKDYKKDRKKQSIISQREKYSQKNVDHRKNINRLMEALKSNSKSQDKGNSAIHKIVKIIDKIYQRYWRIYERIIKRKGFQAIHKRSGKLANPSNISQPLFLKDSLEFQQNQIQRFSKNFQLQDLIQIVELHTKQNQQTDQILDNSLSRELNNQENIYKNISRSPTKISQNIYIMKKGRKQQPQTRPELSNFTTQIDIKSICNIPAEINRVLAITPSIINGKSLLKNILLKEKPLQLDQKYQVINKIPLQWLSIDSFIKEKPSQTQGQSIQIQQQLNKVKMPIFGENYIQKKRTNRLMNPQNKGRKIIFHYKNSHQKNSNPINNYYAGEQVNENNRLKHRNPLTDTRIETNSTNLSLPFQNCEQRYQFESQQVRIQRTTSMQVLNTKIGFQQETKSNKIQNQQLEELISQKKRCSSMPKITFTYRINEDLPAQPQIISQNFQKSSPSFVLNEPKIVNHKNERFIINQNPYLQKNIQFTNICSYNNQINKISKFITPQRVCNQDFFPQKIFQSDYKIPVHNYNVTNKPENSQHIVQKADRYKQYSKQQVIPNKCAFDKKIIAEQIRKNEYYNCMNNINSGQAQKARRYIYNSQKNRVRSTDTYILTKKIDRKPTIIPYQIPQESIISLQRNRAKSCGIKLQLISKMHRLIQAY